jgi:hypothetical protein
MEQILRESHGDEVRLITAGIGDDGDLLIEEQTDGAMTVLAYGALTCVRKLVVHKDQVDAAAWALGMCDAYERGAVKALKKLFSEEDRYLSDIQDMFDAGGVHYTYAVTCGNDLAYRLG